MGNKSDIKVIGTLICEEVRGEKGNRQSLLGLYGPPPADILLPPETKTKDIFIRIAFLTIIEGLPPGNHNVSFRIFSKGSPTPFLTSEIPQPFIVRPDAKRTNIGVNIVPLPLPAPGPGDYSFHLIVEGEDVNKADFSVKIGKKEDFQ